MHPFRLFTAQLLFMNRNITNDSKSEIPFVKETPSPTELFCSYLEPVKKATEEAVIGAGTNSIVSGLTFPAQTFIIAQMTDGVSPRNFRRALLPFNFNGPKSFVKGYSRLALSRSSQVFLNSLGMFYGATIGSLFDKNIGAIVGAALVATTFCAYPEKSFTLKAAKLPQAPVNLLFLTSVCCREGLVATALLWSNSLTPQAKLGIGAGSSVFNSLAIASLTRNLSPEFFHRSLTVIPIRMGYIYVASSAQTYINKQLNFQ